MDVLRHIPSVMASSTFCDITLAMHQVGIAFPFSVLMATIRPSSLRIDDISPVLRTTHQFCIIVPEVDVEQHAAKLFGSGLNLTHMTIAAADISFYYDEELSSYRIPENPKFFTYSPYIEEIQKSGDSYTLTVGYVSPTPAWLTLTSDDTPLPEKYVDYVVQKKATGYTIIAIKASDKAPPAGHDAGL